MKQVPAFLIIALLFSFRVHSQSADSSRFQIGISGSGDYSCYVTYYDGEFDGVNSSLFWEQPYAGWSGGFTSSFRLNKNWSLTSGIRYTEHNTTTGKLTFVDHDLNLLGHGRINFHNRFIDVPIGIQFNSSHEKKIFFIGNAAIAPGYALGQWNTSNLDAEAESNGFSDGSSHLDIPNFNYFSLKAELYTGIGMNFGNFELDLLPQGRFNCLKQTNGNLYVRRFFSTGMEVRVLYSI
jgi:hypothetical protein